MASTIKDIARQLNISVSTVSYALNDGPRTVPPEIKAKVIAVARELDYRPNSLARSMATGRTNTLAVVPPRGAHAMLLSPYLLTVLNGIMEAAEALEQDVLVHTAQGDSEPSGIARSVFGGKADGVVLIAPSVDSRLAELIATRGFPCAVFSSDGPSGTLTLTTDNEAATYQAMRHLTGLGHRHIGHVAGKPGLRDAELRQGAYCRFLQENDLPVVPEWLVGGDFTYARSYQASLRLLALPNRPTAILAANDESGLGVIDAAQTLGLRVPDDLSVIAFDVLPQSVLHMRPITSVGQPLQHMAGEAARLVTEWAQSGVCPAPCRRVFPTDLADMGSTAPPRQQQAS